MAWVVISTSSLLDELHQAGSEVGQDDLEVLGRRSGYKIFPLKNIMRNSALITKATSPENAYGRGRVNIPKSISVGSSCTVSGTRPTWYNLYETGYGFSLNLEVMANYVNDYLEHNKREQTVILCGLKISPRQVEPLLTSDVTLYDAGVEKFDGEFQKPQLYSADLTKQRKDLVNWINNGGILLTHDKMFNGCEAETVVFLAHMWGDGVGQYRSGPTRAVSQLCLVTEGHGLDTGNSKEINFTCIHEQKDQRPSRLGRRGGGSLTRAVREVE